MSDYSALEKLAYNATPGPWTAYDTHGKRFIERVGTEDYVVSETPKRQWLRDSEYIAAANPVVVLGLIEENKAAQSELAALREELVTLQRRHDRTESALNGSMKALTRVDNMWKKRWLDKTGEPAMALIVDDEFKALFEEIKGLKHSLAAAEQRNAELVSMLTKVRDSEVHEGRLLFDSITKLIELTKPTESGASE